MSNNINTGITVSQTPISPAYVIVSVNGVDATVGNGTDIKDCYFFFNNSKFVFSSVGNAGQNSISIKADGTCWCWGDDSKGACGDNAITGGTSGRSSPVSVVGAHSFTYVTTTAQTGSLGLKSDGSCWAWGENSSGFLGDNTTNDRSSPVSVVGNHSFTLIRNDAGIKSDGSCWTWGFGLFGALGNNNSGARSSPVSVVGGHSFIDVNRAGVSLALALKSDGSAWTWGDNGNGQCADNTVTLRSSPVSVVGSHSFAIIGETAALKSDGTCWAWGDNSFGLVGDNTNTNRSSPVSVVGNHSFIFLAGDQGGVVNYALKSDGSVWAWGRNVSANVGDGTTINRSSPVSVIGNHSFIAITRKTGLKSDGSCWAWGANAFGTIGDNTAVQRNSPVQVVNSGGTIRSFGAVVTGDALYWNNSNAGHSLTTSDRVDLFYI